MAEQRAPTPFFWKSFDTFFFLGGGVRRRGFFYPLLFQKKQTNKKLTFGADQVLVVLVGKLGKGVIGLGVVSHREADGGCGIRGGLLGESRGEFFVVVVVEVEREFSLVGAIAVM